MSTLLIIAIAMLVGLLSTRLMKLLHLPNVTGYLIVGLLIGPVLNLITGGKFTIVDEKFLKDSSIITDVALGFIAFSIGGEFKLKHIKQLGGKIVTITMFQALSATLLVDIALWFIAPHEIAIVLGAIATATAPAATLMVVRQYKAKGPVVSALLPVVAFDDAVG
ncbi:MAG: cation:proton antiporter, partial [Clostridia bacterium]